jgi:tRNA/tmRNA/rRNA uracil-C5-methylase (TrmA/RlmC/RlmD family)
LPALERRATPAERDRLREATVILDPPRSGAGREVMASLGRLAPAQIVYVACDPVALARDIAFAATAGYRPLRLRALDMFPHTHHLETVCVLVRD